LNQLGLRRETQEDEEDSEVEVGSSSNQRRMTFAAAGSQGTS
jgi:hypothetical protein